MQPNDADSARVAAPPERGRYRTQIIQFGVGLYRTSLCSTAGSANSFSGILGLLPPLTPDLDWIVDLVRVVL
jgi:hypothetical protein